MLKGKVLAKGRWIPFSWIFSQTKKGTPFASTLETIRRCQQWDCSCQKFFFGLWRYQFLKAERKPALSGGKKNAQKNKSHWVKMNLQHWGDVSTIIPANEAVGWDGCKITWTMLVLGELFLFDGSDLRSFLGSFNSNCSIDFFSCLEHAMKIRTGTDVTCLFFSSSRLPELLDTALVHLSATTFRLSIPAALNDLELCFGSMGHADSPLLLCPVRAWDQHFLKQRMLFRTKCSNCFWRLAYISIYYIGPFERYLL